ncbi:MAG: YvcK family protein [Actinobacteria bacterium]|nr:YvcK family protein [Actinomycetota bacterium]
MSSFDTAVLIDRGVGPGPGDGSRAVAIGGGHGLNRCLRALTHVADDVTAIVTSADDGGSSGRLRRDLGVVPPGDLRMALAALSPRGDLIDLLQYRFGSGELDGHSLGNLIIVAAADLADGDLVEGLERVGRLLGCRGHVVPCSLEPLHLGARVGGRDIEGQVRVALSARVEKVWIAPADVAATPRALEAIERADVIVLGPGSLYTSIIPNLLVPDLAIAVASSRVPVVLVANLREQPGETEGMALHEHVEALLEHAPKLTVDTVIAHVGASPVGAGAPLEVDDEALRTHGARVVTADLLDGADGHDPLKLASILAKVLRESSKPSP